MSQFLVRRHPAGKSDGFYFIFFGGADSFGYNHINDRLFKRSAEMQQEFLTTYLEFSTDSLESKYQLLKATAVFGSLYLASYGIKEGHKEHVMAESLLRNLENNLGILKQKYETMK